MSLVTGTSEVWFLKEVENVRPKKYNKTRKYKLLFWLLNFMLLNMQCT